MNETDYIEQTDDCSDFVNHRGYRLSAAASADMEFPIAYVLKVYHEIEQTERLFRAIYHPQNIYCFHVDAKSAAPYVAAINSVIGCFNNTFSSSTRANVRWGSYAAILAGR